MKNKQWPMDWKCSIYIPILKKDVKECSNYVAIALISHVSKVMSITLSMLQQMQWEIPDVQTGVWKEALNIILQISPGYWRAQNNFRRSV